MTASSIIAALTSVLSWAFVEGLGRFYPARQTWWRLRRVRGRDPLRRTRERFEEAADRRGPRVLAITLLCLLLVWVAVASLLDKRWYEVIADAAPSIIVMAAFVRIPHSLRAIADRMKEYERQAGDDPDAPPEGGDGGATAIAL